MSAVKQRCQFIVNASERIRFDRDKM